MPTLDKAFSILDGITVSIQALTTADIAKKLALPDCVIKFEEQQARMYGIGTYSRNPSGKAIAGIAISFLQSEYKAKHTVVAPALIALAEQIENRLGWVTK